jgi:hypothetical protein
VYKGKLSYTVVVRDAAGNLVDEVGPFPASAFQFVDRCTTGSELLLIDWLSKHGKGK